MCIHSNILKFITEKNNVNVVALACNFYTQFYIYTFNLLAIRLRLTFKIQNISKLLYKTQFCVPFLMN